MSDLASSYYFSWDGLAFLILPTMGAFLTEKIGFPHAMEIVALILLINAIGFTISSAADLRKGREERSVQLVSSGARNQDERA